MLNYASEGARIAPKALAGQRRMLAFREGSAPLRRPYAPFRGRGRSAVVEDGCDVKCSCPVESEFGAELHRPVENDRSVLLGIG